MNKYQLFLLLIGLTFTANCLAVGNTFYPDSDDVILLSLPVGSSTTVKTEDLQENDPRKIAALVNRYLSLSAETGDERYLGYADTLLQKTNSDNVELQLARAALLQRRHQFTLALNELNKILQTESYHAQANLMAAYIYMAQGKGKEALPYCAKAGAVYGELTGLSCSASAQSLLGQLQTNYQTLSVVFNLRRGSKVELREAALSLAEIARMRGDYALAAEHYQQALSLDPRNQFLLMRLADLYIARGYHEACLDLLQEHQQHQNLLLRAAIADKHLHGQVQADRYKRLSNYFELEQLRNPDQATRDYAEYLYHIQNQPDKALSIALQNWQSQREVADAELLVRTAIAAQNIDVLNPLLEWIRTVGLRDAKIEQQLAAVNIEL